ncbi:DNA repair protein RecN [Jeotgalibaca sp. MA1X17-3]|uniref:DNA repair protein RecN n=1 Tax=Jeotgalibaca sp. MA1X17-3 TaxID=2908211 RepID=UPI001F00B98E|nr:DNA repair protein RecN [Jeotgalibaca sp. MA1X17-3]UJF14675.1 DNA repair protein RecN [Jeotgalibaca sp. MA1X17-3]
MLQELSIKNFAIIENLQVSFEDGMTVLSGETGAGKSIIIDAVGLLAGGRGSADLIRHGENKTVLQGQFEMPSSQRLKELLNEYGIEASENQIILQRELSRNGKNVARINGTIITVAVLRKIAENLIDIHGQNEHQELMNPQKHLMLLDRFGDEEDQVILNQYQKLYEGYQTTKAELKELLSDEKENVQRIDLLNFQINEIEEAKLEDDQEEEQLEEERNRLVNYQKIIQGLTLSYGAIQEDEGNGLDQIGLAMAALEKIQDFSLTYQTIYSDLSAAYYQLQECAFSIRNEMDEMSYDEERLNEIEIRLELLHQLRRKYGSSISDIKTYYQKIALELDKISNRESYAEKLTNTFNEIKKELLEVGKKLTEKRKKTALLLKKEIEKQLKELYMEKASFEVHFHENEKQMIRSDGLDSLEFYIATNVGEPLKPLAKVASGGELSRMMLALKTIFTQTQGITSIIFDEVDTGVSGRVAQAIANKIHLVSEYSQVLCITHLPQVAAMADHHFYIEKEVYSDRTKTHVHSIVKKERINEIARMLAGTDITDLSVAHANELLDLAMKQKA